jgi:hypothetical protein
MRGLDEHTDPKGRGRFAIFDDFRQFASDGELVVRGRPSKDDRWFSAPHEFVPADHWREFEFQDGAYIANDGDVSGVRTERIGLMGSIIYTVPGAKKDRPITICS